MRAPNKEQRDNLIRKANRVISRRHRVQDLHGLVLIWAKQNSPLVRFVVNPKVSRPFMGCEAVITMDGVQMSLHGVADLIRTDLFSQGKEYSTSVIKAELTNFLWNQREAVRAVQINTRWAQDEPAAAVEKSENE